jgi:hypothetical protein
MQYNTIQYSTTEHSVGCGGEVMKDNWKRRGEERREEREKMRRGKERRGKEREKRKEEMRRGKERRGKERGYLSVEYEVE